MCGVGHINNLISLYHSMCSSADHHWSLLYRLVTYPQFTGPFYTSWSHTPKSQVPSTPPGHTPSHRSPYTPPGHIPPSHRSLLHHLVTPQVTGPFYTTWSPPKSQVPSTPSGHTPSHRSLLHHPVTGPIYTTWSHPQS